MAGYRQLAIRMMDPMISALEVVLERERQKYPGASSTSLGLAYVIRKAVIEFLDREVPGWDPERPIASPASPPPAAPAAQVAVSPKAPRHKACPSPAPKP